jgi:hypothetical protein
VCRRPRRRLGAGLAVLPRQLHRRPSERDACVLTDLRIEKRASGGADADGEDVADAVLGRGDARARTSVRPINTPAETACSLILR